MERIVHIGLMGGSRLLREALASRLATASNVAVNAIAEDIESAVDLCATTPINVWFVLTANLRENELEALIFNLSATTRLICLGREFLGTSACIDAVQAGRIQWLEADATYEVMLLALRRLMTVERTCSPQVLATVAKQIEYWRRSLPSDQKCSPGLLTIREREVARLAAGGLINKQIAKQLGIGITTVKSHLNSAMRKLQVQRRGDLQRGLGTPPTLRSGDSRPFPYCAIA